MKIRFSKAYSNGAELKDGVLSVENGLFSGISSDGSADLDLTAFNVFPGFIDMHSHGGHGNDCMNNSYEELDELSKYYASNGVSTFIATTVTNTMENTLPALDRIASRIENGTSGACMAGIYLEGPYLSVKYRGAHEEALLRKINLDEIKEILDAARGTIKIFAIAPELPGALDAIRYINSRGSKVSLGHSAANQAEATRGIDAGGKIVIHTYNAMSPLNHRDVGLLGTALTRNDVYCELICDMIHVCAPAIDIVLRCKTLDKLILITDSMAAAGMPDGNQKLGNMNVTVKNGIIRTLDGALAGSSLRSNTALKNLVTILKVPVEAAMKALTINPAIALGMNNEIGTLDTGKRAHLTALDDDFNVVLTMVDGKIVYDAR